MGWSAFTGFLVLLLGWPLNSLLSKRSVRIQKGTMAARDKRMGVLNELIGAVSRFIGREEANADARPSKVKFIKFFAWENKWIEKAMDARNTEIKWMVKGLQPRFHRE